MRTTFCRVKIITPELPWQPSETFEWSGPAGSQTLSDLMRVETASTVDGPVNGFTLHLSPHHFGQVESLAQRIPAYSLVFIDMGVAGEDEDPTVMIGLTEPAVESERWTPQGPQRSMAIRGRGIEAVLVDANVWWAPYLETHALAASDLDRTISDSFLEQLTGQLVWAKQIIGEDIDPRQAVLSILFYYLLNHGSSFMNLLLPGDNKIRDLLLPAEYTPADLTAALAKFPPKPGTKYKVPRSWTYIGDSLGLTKLLLQTGSIHPQPGPILNMLYQVMDRAFHELFVTYERDGGNGKGQPRARIVHRIKPFALPGFSEALDVIDWTVLGRRPTASRFALNDVETVEMTADDLMGSTLAHGMRDVKNVFFVSPGQGAFFDEGGFKALLAPEFCGRRSQPGYIGRYGIRPFEHTSPHMVIGVPGGDQQAAVIKAAEEMSRTLRVWYEPQPIMLEGTIQVRGRARYRAGRRLVWHGRTEDGQQDGRPTREFYIRGVQHSYDFASGAFLSTLQVNRGWQIGPAPAGAH